MSSAPPDDERALVVAAQAGDRDALDTLVARYERRVHRFGLAMCRDGEAAREVLQDTFLAMVRSLRAFRADASLSTWLYAIAHNACARRARRPAAAPRGIESLEGLTPADEGTLIAPGPDPESAAAGREMARALDAALQRLAGPERAVLMLRDVEGLPASEVATALGISVAAVKSRLHRARAKLRATLAGGGMSSGGAGSCPDVLAALSRHLEGDLTPRACAEMDAHLQGCEACRAACASLRDVLASCRASTAPNLPPDTGQRLRDALRACRVGPA
ncbi:MAG: sigma-70 family RNA polymerase sigma factor [Acidobacteria bacterium]|nr:sigma-70 family RNA polymerase sigma factor [Acidobacteriota bacterium]